MDWIKYLLQGCVHTTLISQFCEKYFPKILKCQSTNELKLDAYECSALNVVAEHRNCGASIATSNAHCNGNATTQQQKCLVPTATGLYKKNNTLMLHRGALDRMLSLKAYLTKCG